jgi:hypothetical protein
MATKAEGRDAATPQVSSDPLPGVTRPDHNREKTPGTTVAAEIELNSPYGVGLDFNQDEKEDRGPKTEENETAQGLIDASEPEDPNSDYIGDRLTADAINTPGSVYLSPAMDFKDPPDLEEPEPPADPEPDPDFDSGILRRVAE